MMILVIGGTGKAGREIVTSLAVTGAEARVVVRDRNRFSDIEKLGLQPIFADLADISSIATALHGIDKLVLLTPASREEARLKMAVIEAAKRAGVNYVLLLSGAGAEHDSSISQARQHALADDYLAASGLDYTILRPYFFMQNFLAQAAVINSQGAIYGNYGYGRLAMVDTGDIAAVEVTCLNEPGHNGRTYVITGSQALTHAEIAQTLSAQLKKEVNYVNLPSKQLITGLVSMGYPDWLASDLAGLGEEIAEGRFAKCTDVVTAVGRKDPCTFERFVGDHIKLLIPQS